jgi:hypothetical protein
MNLNENLYVSSNQTNDCMILSNKNKFMIYYNTPFKINFDRIMPNDIHQIKMFYKTNILFIVEKQNMNELILWDDIQQNCR